MPGTPCPCLKWVARGRAAYPWHQTLTLPSGHPQGPGCPRMAFVRRLACGTGRSGMVKTWLRAVNTGDVPRGGNATGLIWCLLNE